VIGDDSEGGDWWYAQDEVNQEDSEQNEVDGMKMGADLYGVDAPDPNAILIVFQRSPFLVTVGILRLQYSNED